jgi:hypothetical protein
MGVLMLAGLRPMRPEVVDGRIAEVVEHLRRVEFLRGTRFEARAMELNVDPYSLLLGIVIGIAITAVLGLATIEIWLPRAIARLTGKTIEETMRAVSEALGK